MPYKDIEKQRAYSKKHYKDNKNRYFERNSVNRKKIRDFVHGIKESTPCADCGLSYPYYVMDFDHQSDKKGLIIDFIRRNNRAALELEINKCEIVCSNCHRIRSYNRLLAKK